MCNPLLVTLFYCFVVFVLCVQASFWSVSFLVLRLVNSGEVRATHGEKYVFRGFNGDTRLLRHLGFIPIPAGSETKNREKLGKTEEREGGKRGNGQTVVRTSSRAVFFLSLLLFLALGFVCFRFFLVCLRNSPVLVGFSRGRTWLISYAACAHRNVGFGSDWSSECRTP